MPENAVDTTQWLLTDPVQPNPGRFVFIGRLVDWKALDIVLEALLTAPNAMLDVIGDGPMLQTWRELVVNLDLTERVRFLGWKTQTECAQSLAGCCALVLPSLYECGGAVVLEAMAMSRPVIATAWGGPADYIDATCGILVEPTGRAEMVSGFAVAMQQLMDTPELRSSMGAAGRERLQMEFDWNRKIDQVLAIYESCL